MDGLAAWLLAELHGRDAEALARSGLRLLAAAVLGGALGLERARQGKAAGLRTHMLVALGAALLMQLPAAGIEDLSRVIQGVITGIGFLGAGAIIKHRSTEDVQGLTTAAGIWMTAAIGIACGTGNVLSALLGTLLALFILALLPKVAERH